MILGAEGSWEVPGDLEHRVTDPTGDQPCRQEQEESCSGCSSTASSSTASRPVRAVWEGRSSTAGKHGVVQREVNTGRWS